MSDHLGHPGPSSSHHTQNVTTPEGTDDGLEEDDEYAGLADLLPVRLT